MKTPDTSKVRALAERLTSGEGGEAPTLAAPGGHLFGRSGSNLAQELPAPVRVSPASRSPQASPGVKPSPQPSAGSPNLPAAPTDPVENIALMGVTHSEGGDQAWLVDVSTQEREIVDEGGAAWGFTVKDIADEHIVLARGSNQFTIRLGEKEIPAVAGADTAGVSTADNSGGWGRGGGDQNARRERFRQMMASGAFNRGNWGGNRGGNRSWGGNRSRGSRSSWSGNRSSNRGSWNNSSRNRSGGSNNRSNRVSGGRGGFTGGVNPAAMRFGSNFYGNRRGGGNNFASGNAGPTSNPQTARRRGGQLIGGANPIENPRPISNPQTTRRLGTNTTQAFGNNNYSGSQSRNRSSSNRSR